MSKLNDKLLRYVLNGVNSRGMVRGKFNSKAAHGKRYTSGHRQKIVQFVIKLYREKGRGGVSAAAKKFGGSPSSIGKWISGNGSGRGSKRSSRPELRIRKNEETAKVLAQLIELRESMDALERELAMKSAQFDELMGNV